MCQRVYIASSVELPRVRRGAQSPYLEVATAPDSAVREIRPLLRPDLPFVHLAGGHLACGCGFPSETTESHPDPSRLDQADLASLSALAEYVRPACSKYATVQLYLCWASQEGLGPVTRRSATLDDLRQPGFRLRHQEVLTVGRNLDPRRRRTRG
jgi:hypothetical protein